MSRNRIFLATGLVVFLLALVTQAPAALMAPVLRSAGLNAGSFAGSVWRGEARPVSAGSLRIERLRWQLRPAALLIGRLDSRIDAELAQGFVSGEVGLSLTGRLLLRELEGAGPLAAFAPGLAPGGEIAVQLAEVVWHDDWPESAIGTVRLANLSLGIPGEGRGSYVARFDAADIPPGEPLSGELVDGGGPLEINGTLRLTPPRNYEITGTARARPGAPAELGQMLQMAGPVRADGSHEFSLAGSF